LLIEEQVGDDGPILGTHNVYEKQMSYPGPTHHVDESKPVNGQFPAFPQTCF
jgi:hypothetical protein